MDHQRFDALARQIARQRSRRSVLKELVAGVLAGAAGAAGIRGAAADSEPDQDRDNNNGRGCKRAGKNCKTDSQCCAGLICPNGDSCAPGCRIDGVAVSPGPNPTNNCLTCDPAVSTSAWTPVTAGVSCDDGDPCTVSDSCDGAGSCIGSAMDCSALSDACHTGVCQQGECLAQPIAGGPCDDGDACTGEGTCQTDGSCAAPLLEPTVSCPANQHVASAAGMCGAVVSYSATASCAPVICTHPSDTTFAVGSTTVTCSASNAAGSAQCSFTVTVSDEIAPDISCPADITTPATGATGAIVHFATGATDNCAPVNVVCEPASGALFSIGATTVTCIATDPSSRTDSCTFTVNVTCTPDCAGKSCGATDGCGGTCAGPCPDPGGCQTAVCDDSHTCVTTNKEPGSECGDRCTGGAICDDSGRCTGGFAISCPESTDPCRERFGTCDPAVGCVYDLLQEGEVCGNEGDLCRASRCTASGSCEPTHVTCNEDCQICNPSTGACQSINDGGVCGDSSGYCSGGVCTSPCGEACADYCYQNLDVDGEPMGTFFCCPEGSRGPNGGCCWVQDAPGMFSDDGFCSSPYQVCADGLHCWTECCGGTAEGRSGVCPTATEYCVDGNLIETGAVCTTDADCVTAGYGGSARCAYLEYTVSENGSAPVPNSGTCCPPGYVHDPEFLDSGPVYICCAPGSKITSTGDCCSYPAYASGACIGCNCSFRNITRCCS